MVVMGMNSDRGPFPYAEFDIDISFFRKEDVGMEKPPAGLGIIDPFFVKPVAVLKMLDDGPPQLVCGDPPYAVTISKSDTGEFVPALSPCRKGSAQSFVVLGTGFFRHRYRNILE